MRILRKCFGGAFLVLGLVALQGCGGGGPKIAPVEGSVKQDGKPLDKILVEFWPDAGGQRSLGETDSQGHFKLKTDDGKQDGAVVGSHKIVLRDSGALGDKFMGREGETVDLAKGKKSRISGKYGASETSPLSKSVEAGKTNQFDIEIGK